MIQSIIINKDFRSVDCRFQKRATREPIDIFESTNV